MEPINVFDYERLAEERLPAATLGYYAGGAGDEWTLRENRQAFERLVLRPRVLRGLSEPPRTATTVLGTDVSMPLLVAPLSLQRLAHADGEAATARGAAAAGTLFCLSTTATSSPAEIAAAAPDGPRWFQLYVFRDEGVTRSLVEQAVEHGFGALVLTADTPYLGRRERDLRNDFVIPEDLVVPTLLAARGPTATEPFATHAGLMSPSVGWQDIERLASMSGLPVVVKGILTAEDAHLAIEHGAAAVIVSNHGGRQLDGVAASLDALPEVVQAVEGRVEVLMDGGIRRGTDVLKALALGARAVLAGRAVLWGLAVGGEDGVQHVLELLREEVSLGLALLGCSSPAEVTPAHIGPARR
ncbi:MAG: 4-hydroxymandelate oxidase [Gaiellaceae bacterium]|nr:4-hydroxymandelate oxidase [Gaiellaceae bacterium]